MYDLILTDINMPEMDGMVMSKQIHELLYKSTNTINEARNVKIYAVTAMNDEFIKENYKDFGIIEVIQKPIDVDKLKNIIESAFTSL